MKWCITLVLLTGTAVSAQDFEQQQAANWHQWRGPTADGVSETADPPVRWSPNENVLWKAAIPGSGSATPVVWGDRIFLATAVRTDEPAGADVPKRQEYQIPPPPAVFYRFVLLCLDLKTGDVLWSRDAIKAVPHEGHHNTHSYAAASPVTNGRQVFVSFGSRGIFGFDMEGKKLWECDPGDMQTRRGWGEGASPALYDDTLIVNWDHEGDSFIFALNTADGEERWRVPRNEPTSWATPLIVRHKKQTHVVVSATNTIRSYDLKTGEEIWRCSGLHLNVIPSPVARDGIVYCMSNYRRSAAFAIPLDVRGDVRAAGRLKWSHTGNTPYCPSPLLYGELLYFTSQNSAILSVLNANNGEQVGQPFRLPSIRNIYASPVAAQGRIYITGRDGTTLVYQHGSKPQLLATNSVGEPVDASPVMVGKKMLIRGSGHLFCVQEEAEAAAAD